MLAYIATIQVVVDPDQKDPLLGPLAAADGISEMFRNLSPFVLDWSFLKLGGQFCYPVEKLLDEDYEEGEAFK